jgi:prepilin-type N-terminal cleavage/methylation domain-containing protein
MNRNRAFTLIELLVVIAIIAILAGIIFPVFARVKLNAYKSGDMSAMNSIRNALQLYRDDQGGYPPALLGYISPYEYGNGAAVVPADQIRGALYPRRIDSLETLRPALNRVDRSLMVPGIWPPVDSRPTGSAPIVDTNGDGAVTNADDIPNARQAHGSSYSSGVVEYYYNDRTLLPTIGASNDNSITDVGRFYAVSGYDVAQVRIQGDLYYEVHYTPFWTLLGTTTGGINDDPRQLGYTEPPETTVITWNSFFREYSNGVLTNGGSKDMVLQLGGAARPVDSKLMSERSWRFTF